MGVFFVEKKKGGSKMVVNSNFNDDVLI